MFKGILCNQSVESAQVFGTCRILEQQFKGMNETCATWDKEFPCIWFVQIPDLGKYSGIQHVQITGYCHGLISILGQRDNNSAWVFGLAEYLGTSMNRNLPLEVQCKCHFSDP